jgi:hypothetical protein
MFGRDGFAVLARCTRSTSPTVRYFAARGPGATHLPDAAQFECKMCMNDAMRQARDACWEYLSSAGLKYDFKSRDSCATRTVLALLCREPPPIDLSESCYWFLSFADEVEDRSESLDALIRKHFPDGE